MQNADVALSFAAAYSAPSFAFMGITFPATNMNTLAQIWQDLIPVSHYMQIQLYQSNHGASIETALPQMGALVLFFNSTNRPELIFEQQGKQRMIHTQDKYDVLCEKAKQ